MKWILLAIALSGCGEANWGPQGEEPCEMYQGNYLHTIIKCGDYYDDLVVLCDENGNYERPLSCVTPTEVYAIIADNKPCKDCGCITQNVCETLK